jgi:hypothetical protein
MRLETAHPSLTASFRSPPRTRPFTPKERRFPSALQPQAVENRLAFPNHAIPLTPPTPAPSPPRNGAFQAPSNPKRLKTA